MYVKKPTVAERIAFIEEYAMKHSCDFKTACKAWDVKQEMAEGLRLEAELKAEKLANMKKAIFEYDKEAGKVIAVSDSIISAVKAIVDARSDANKAWTSTRLVPSKDDSNGRTEYYAFLDSAASFGKLAYVAGKVKKAWRHENFQAGKCFAQASTIKLLESLIK